MDAKVLYILITAGCLIFVLYQGWKMVSILLRKSASGAWQTTIGKVESKTVSVQSGSKGGKSYIPKITYPYSVMGEKYLKKISLGTRWWESSAYNAISEIGDTLEVRYNPEKPKEHISDQEKIRIFNLFLVLLYLFIALTVLILISGAPITSGHGGGPK
jgi:hypothetical protein